MAHFRARQHLRSANSGYFLCGLCVASWAPLIPIIQEHLNLDNYIVGLMVFAFGLGSISGMSFSGIFANSIGFKKTYILSSFLSAFFIIFLAFIPSYYLLFPSVFFFGLAIGFLEVLINIYGAALEKHYKIFFLSPLFAYYSMGEVIGSVSILILLSLDISSAIAITPLVLLFYAITLFYANKVLDIECRSEGKKQSFIWPRGAIINLSIIVCITFVVGGATIDWSAIFIREVIDLDTKYTVFGYALVSFCMLICRMYSKSIVRLLGLYQTVLYGAITMLIGLFILLIFSSIEAFILGFILVGIGMSNISPLSMSAVAKQKDMPLVAAISTISTIGYAGLMFAPGVLGIIAGFYSAYAIYVSLAILCLISTSLIILTKKTYLREG